jgi:hypothetical protein
MFSANASCEIASNPDPSPKARKALKDNGKVAVEGSQLDAKTDPGPASFA